ncbi:MAG TPA: hypothetical protein VIK12_03180 [Pengzhenrongella sp.]
MPAGTPTDPAPTGPVAGGAGVGAGAGAGTDGAGGLGCGVDEGLGSGVGLGVAGAEGEDVGAGSGAGLVGGTTRSGDGARLVGPGSSGRVARSNVRDETSCQAPRSDSHAASASAFTAWPPDPEP